MLAAAYGTVSDIELVWTLISFTGIGFGIFNLRDAWGDRRFQKEHNIQDDRKIIANYAVRQESMRISIQILFSLVGCLAMLLPEPPPLPLESLPTIASFVARWSFILASFLILGKSIDSYVTRHKLTGE